jgi:hypothetical protein
MIAPYVFALVLPASAQVGVELAVDIPAGATDVAGLATLYMAQGYTANLARTTYTLTGPITMPSGGRLVCRDGYATLVPADSYTDVAGADLDTGVIRAAATVSASSSGALVRTTRKRGHNIQLPYDPGAGAKLRLKSVTGQSGTVFVAYGADVIGYEYVEVASTASAGGGNFNCALAESPWQNHGAGTTAHAVTTPIEGIHVEGINLQFAGKTHAAGIVLDTVNGARVERCRASGFSRAQVSVKNGSRGVEIEDFVTELGTNCAIRIQSSDFVIRNVRTRRGGARKHASGITRGLITIRHASRGTIDGFSLEGASTGISCWGGSVAIRNGIIRDMDPVVRAANDTELVTINSVRTNSSALEYGCYSSPSAWGEWGLGHSIQNVRIEDCGGVDSPGFNSQHPAAYFVNMYGLHVDGLEIINTGAGNGEFASPELAGFPTGIICYDVAQGQFNNCSFTGIEAPFRLEGNGNTGSAENVSIDNFNGQTNASVSFLKLGGSGATNWEFGTVKLVSNDGSLFATGYSAPTAATMHAVRVRSLIYLASKQRWDNCLFAKNQTTSTPQGEEVEWYTNATPNPDERSFRDPSTVQLADKATAICSLGASAAGPCAVTQWSLIATGPGYRSIKSSESATLTYGDTLKAGTGRDIIKRTGTEETKGIVVDVVSGGFVQTYRAA